MRLTEQRRQILEVLGRTTDAVERGDGHAILLDAREIANACGRARNASDWAVGKLREMAWHGLCEPAGVTFANARTWRITPAGRAALSETTGE